jgi:hypothetical protein
MSRYEVYLLRTEVLSSREVQANSIKEAEEKALPLFDKQDIDDYDDIEVRDLDEVKP